MSEEDEEYLWIPTTTQQKIVSLNVILPSLLSFLGSSLIIYHVIHDKRKTPYRRILLGMSFFDIWSTLGWVTQPYLMTSNVINSYVWSFGNETSCKAIATFSQTGVASQIYSSCLSFYFLLTIRFGMREKTFEKRIEKLMHFVVVLFSVGTAITGLVNDMYYPLHVGPGCWISHPPEGDICANDSCGAERMAWISGGMPVLLCILTITVNNLILYCHVRSTVKRGQAKALAMEARLAAYNKARATGQQEEVESEDEADDIRKLSLSERLSEKLSGRSKPSGLSTSESNNTGSVLRSSDREWQRVKEVGTQSFLYVGSYFLCFIWSIVKSSLDGQGLDKVEGSGSIFLPLVLLQSIFLPIHGFFSCLIFFRPKYMQNRKKYGEESRLWCMKKTVFTTKVRPTSVTTSTLTTSDRSKAKRRIDYERDLDPREVGMERSRMFKKSLRMVNPLNSNNESSVVSAVSVTEDDQESVRSNAKKQSGNGKRVTYSDDPLRKASAHSNSIASIVEELEISDCEASPNPGSIDNDMQSQDNSVLSVTSSSKRVSHTGEIVEVR